MQDARELWIHLGKHNSTYVIRPEVSDRQLSEVIAKLKQLGENNSVAVLRAGERENGYYGGTGIEQLDRERYETFLAQADELVQNYAAGKRIKVVDQTILKPVHRGSLPLGIVGAIGGGLIGAVIFGAVAYFGFFISYLGFIIARLAAMGYDRLGGQQGPLKRIILIGVIFLSVILGFLFAHAATFSKAMEGDLIAGFQMAWRFFRQRPTAFFNTSFIIGLVFAYLGAMNVLRQRY